MSREFPKDDAGRKRGMKRRGDEEERERNKSGECPMVKAEEEDAKWEEESGLDWIFLLFFCFGANSEKKRRTEMIEGQLIIIVQ